MDYKQAVDYLDKTIIFGIKPGLERINRLCKLLDNPQREFKAIQITGTNGKSSVARMTASILSAHGFKVGAYISPHLQSYTERITIDSKPIEEKDFAALLEEIAPFIEGANKSSQDPLTHFEILTALSFLYFAREKVDVAVLEVGMGGRWDATSVIRPKVAVVTNVELEHTDQLGSTVTEIAREKVHIIKGKSFAVGGRLNGEALSVIIKRCQEKQVLLRLMGADFSLLSCNNNGDGPKLVIKGLFATYKDLSLGLLGKHQAENSALAVATVEAFLKKPLEPELLKEGFSKSSIGGRLEVVAEKPLVVLDGAHNPAAALLLSKALRAEFDYHHLILVLGIFENKDIRGLLGNIVPLAWKVILSQNSNERCAEARLLMDYASHFEGDFVVEPNLGKAIDRARTWAKKDDLVCVTGSLYTVGEARDYFKLKPL